MNLALNQSTSDNSFSIYNIIESIRSTGNIRNTSWLFTRASKGYFNGISAEDAVNFADTMDSIISVLNRVYGENWDFNLRPVTDGSRYLFDLWVIIHYPKVTISNEEEQTHEIKDLLLSFRIKERGTDDTGRVVYAPGELYGTKATFSYEEWFSSYVHSHLGTRKPDRFNRCFALGEFCIGTGELYDLQATLRSEYSEGIFELYLITLQSLVNWESREGGPYIYMKDINIGDKSRIADNLNNESNLRSFYNSVRRKLKNLNVDFILSEGRYKIVHNFKFVNLIKDIIVEELQDETITKNTIVTRKGENFYGYSFPRIWNKEELKEKFQHSTKGLPYTLIQGKKIEFKVEEFTGEMPDISNYGVHPKFLNYVSTKLEQELYKKTIRRGVIERHNQSINA